MLLEFWRGILSQNILDYSNDTGRDAVLLFFVKLKDSALISAIYIFRLNLDSYSLDTQVYNDKYSLDIGLSRDLDFCTVVVK